MEQLRWFSDNEIPFHAQIVLCPDYNDGDELERTLNDLTEFGENLLSAAVVPVGLTKYRGAAKLNSVDEETARKTLEIASKYKKVCCSDEFFLLAGQKIPQAQYYGSFSQLDDGVGSIRLFLDDFYSLVLPQKISKPLNVLFAASYAAKSAMEAVSDELNKIKNLSTRVVPVKSNYWGEDITVAGLITSGDLIETIKEANSVEGLKGLKVERNSNHSTIQPFNLSSELAVIPSVMLRPYSEDFLDGKNLDYVREQTGMDFFVIRNIYSMKEFVDFLGDLA
jgi:NifB/MoaA-like Fe-S oxidoreductase